MGSVGPMGGTGSYLGSGMKESEAADEECKHVAPYHVC